MVVVGRGQVPKRVPSVAVGRTFCMVVVMVIEKGMIRSRILTLDPGRPWLRLCLTGSIIFSCLDSYCLTDYCPTQKVNNCP